MTTGWWFKFSTSIHIYQKSTSNSICNVKLRNSKPSNSLNSLTSWYVAVCQSSDASIIHPNLKYKYRDGIVNGEGSGPSLSSALRSSDGVRFSSSEYAKIFCILIFIFFFVIINHDNKIWIYFWITRLKSKNFLTKLFKSPRLRRIPFIKGKYNKNKKIPPLDKEGVRGRFVNYSPAFKPLLKFLLKVDKASFNWLQVNPS